MAFTDTTYRVDVRGSFSTTGVSDSTYIFAADLFISGTFDGTVVLEAQDRDGTWHTSCSFTAPATRVIEWAARRPMRVRCTAFNSGQIDYILESLNEQLSSR